MSEPRINFRTILLVGLLPSAPDSAAFSGALPIAEILNAGELSRALSSGSARNLSEAFQQLNPSEQNALRTRWGRSLDELISLSNERDATIFHRGLLEVGHRLEDADEGELASVVYSSLVANPSSLGGEGARRADEGATPAGILARAQSRLNAMNGVGDWRARLALNLERLPTNATRWDMLFAMGGAGLVFRGVRLAATARWASGFESAFALNAATTSSAFLAETAAFTGFGRLFGTMAGNHYDWSAEGSFNEWAGGAAMLLGLKAMGGVFGHLSERWAAGETPFAGVTRAFAPQAGMFSGIVLGNRLAELGGFHPERHGDTWLTDGLTTLLEFNIAGRLQRSAGGPGLMSLEGRMETYTRSLVGLEFTAVSRSKDRLLRGVGEVFAPNRVTPEGLRISEPREEDPLTQHTVYSVRHDRDDDSGVRPIPTDRPRPDPRELALHRRPTVILEKNRGTTSEPAPRPRPPGSLLGHFEYAYDPRLLLPVMTPATESTLVLGRATASQSNVFPEEFRHISRRQFELRMRGHAPEIRSVPGSLGLRLNEQRLAPERWYRLENGDLLEIISPTRLQQKLWRSVEGEENLRVETLHQSGDRAYRGGAEILDTDRPPVFRFRLAPEPQESPRTPGLLERVARSFQQAFQISEPKREAGVPPSDRPPAPPRPAQPIPETLWTELHRTAEELHGGIALFEAGLRAEEIGMDTLATLQSAPQKILQPLLSVHRRFFGSSTRVIHLEGVNNRVPEARRVPYWSGRAVDLLEYYEAALHEIRREDPEWPRLPVAEHEVHRIKDYFNRLYEVVRLYRRHFTVPEHLALFDVMESSYDGLRPPARVEGERVRSATLSLDVWVSAQDRLAWIANFRERQPSSLAMLNAQILLSQVLEVRGRRIAGSFYQALAHATIHEGTRLVRIYFDREGGEIVGFIDGTRGCERAIAALQEEGRRLEEIRFLIDVAHTGTITDITGISANNRTAITEALRELRGLQVVPATEARVPSESSVPEISPAISHQEFWGSDDLGTVEGASYWRIVLNPPLDTPAHQQRRVIAITPPHSAPDGSAWRLVTFETSNPSETSTISQLWVPVDWVGSLRRGTLVAVTPYY